MEVVLGEALTYYMLKVVSIVQYTSTSYIYYRHVHSSNALA